mgnify:CR=1 FL=1
MKHLTLTGIWVVFGIIFVACGDSESSANSVGEENNDLVEVKVNADDIDTALRYAQQYLRKMQTEEETSEEWASAQILSIERY